MLHSKYRICVHICCLHHNNVSLQPNLKNDLNNIINNNNKIIKIAMIQYIHKKKGSLITTTPLLKMYTQRTTRAGKWESFHMTRNWIQEEQQQKNNMKNQNCCGWEASRQLLEDPALFPPSGWWWWWWWWWGAVFSSLLSLSLSLFLSSFPHSLSRTWQEAREAGAGVREETFPVALWLPIQTGSHLACSRRARLN